MTETFRFRNLHCPSAELELMLRSEISPSDGLDDEDEVDCWWSEQRRLISDWDVVYAISRQLELGGRGSDDPLFNRMVDLLVPTLEDVCSAARSRDRSAAKRQARRVPATALLGSTLPELLAMYEVLKWRGTVLESVKLANLAKYLRQIAAQNIEDRIEKMLCRWEALDLAALANRHAAPRELSKDVPRRTSISVSTLRERQRDRPSADYTAPTERDASRT